MATQPTAPTPPAGRAQADGQGRAQALRVDVVTIFPGMFEPFLRESFVRLAREKDRLAVEVHDLRDWTRDRHRTVDDAPYGGGPGMVMKPEPLVTAAEELAGPKGPERRARVVLLTPQGRRLNQPLAEDLATSDRLLLLCGRYEGFDQRVSDLLEPEEISIGDYVLNGGEVAAMTIIDAVVRLVPGVLGDETSNREDSFSRAGRTLEYAQYTRPREYRGLEVPEVLLSGNHQEIAAWREADAARRTAERRGAAGG